MRVGTGWITLRMLPRESVGGENDAEAKADDQETGAEEVCYAADVEEDGDDDGEEDHWSASVISS